MSITQGDVHGKHFLLCQVSFILRGVGMGPAAHRAPPGLAVLLAGQDLVPEIKMLSPLSLFQAKCQESNYG